MFHMFHNIKHTKQYDIEIIVKLNLNRNNNKFYEKSY